MKSTGITFHVEPEEKQALADEAHDLRIPLSELCRRRVLKQPEKLPPEDFSQGINRAEEISPDKKDFDALVVKLQAKGMTRSLAIKEAKKAMFG